MRAGFFRAASLGMLLSFAVVFIRAYLSGLYFCFCSSETQVLEYIQHYPRKLTRAEIFRPDGDLTFSLCHVCESEGRAPGDDMRSV